MGFHFFFLLRCRVERADPRPFMEGRSCCLKQKLKKGLWSPEEDEKLFNYITRFGIGCWSTVPKLAGLQRCGKSCRLRWINYLRPDLKRGMFSQQEEVVILSLHQVLGNRWAQIAAHLPGRTDNEIKNFWHSYLKKKLMKQGIDPATHKPIVREAVEVIESENVRPEETQLPPPLPPIPPFVIRPNEPEFLLSDDPMSGFPVDVDNDAIRTANKAVVIHPSSPLLGIQQIVDDYSSTFMGTSTNIVGTETISSDNLASRMMTSLLFDEAASCRDVHCPNIAAAEYRMNGHDLESINGAGPSLYWGSGQYCGKANVPSSHQFQLNGIIKPEEILKPTPWSSHQDNSVVTVNPHNALDLGDYPLTSMMPEDFYDHQLAFTPPSIGPLLPIHHMQR
ncbi:hypothetical protein SAY87_006401 [Trapa incisa]|uniref:Uncharacterized protein n=1 Tax=Trapa incisa TaxID=236973 RepID=A0AAN7PZ66_9MYRT|nr:hypothetical protein SAY87_006401 [Trapa incisa]